jgi:outer membrane immunogenic protein
MKRLVLSVFALAALVTPSIAADVLPSRGPMAPVRAPAVLPFNWGGWYGGVNFGAGWGNDSVDGVIGGAQIGFNWQMNLWVFGVETDIQGSGMSGSRVVTVSSTAMSESQDLDWFGTLRGRIGYAAWDRWLPYFTIGFAYGGRSVSGTASGGGVSGSYSSSWTDVGLAIGLGVDYAINQWWTARLEYLYVNIPGATQTYALTGGTRTVAYSDLDASIFRGALNYRFAF